VEEIFMPIWCCKCALRCSMNAWKIPFVIGIETSGQTPLTTSSSRQLKHPLFYAHLIESQSGKINYLALSVFRSFALSSSMGVPFLW
jgi:hypothetical protein